MLKVIIVDDEPLIRMGIKSLINWQENGFSIEGEASNGKEAMSLIYEYSPDIVLTDIKMPVMDGIELIKEINRMDDRPEIIVLSCFDDFLYVKGALKSGAAEYLIKSDIKSGELLDTLLTVSDKIKNSRIVEQDSQKINAKSISYLKKNYLEELIMGKNNDNNIQPEFVKLRIKLLPENLFVIKIMLDNFSEIRKKYSEDDDKLLETSITGLIERVVPNSYNCEIITNKSSKYIMLFNADSIEPLTGALKICNNIVVTINEYINISVTIGTSLSFNSFEGINNAYEQASTAIKRRFFEGTGKVYHYGDIPDNVIVSDQKFLDSKLMTKFKDLIQTSNLQGSIEIVKELSDYIRLTRCRESIGKRMYIKLAELFISSQTVHIPVSNDESTPYERILELDTNEDIKNLIMNMLKEYFNAVANGSYADNKTYADKAADLIKNHYNSEISLQWVASNININPSYLSRIFKQEKGESFIDYLTKIRIEQAKYYLRAKSYKVYEVAEKVGYQNTTYFSKLFKRIVGFSPEMYAEKNK